MKPHWSLPLLAVLIAVSASAQQISFDPNADAALDEVLTIDDQELIPSFGAEVRVVTVPVVVKGPQGVYVDGLEQSDFTLLDNGDLQEITGFDVSFQPISMVICVQTSDRVEKILDPIRKTAYLFTDAVLGEFGEAAIIGYDSRVKILNDFTGDTQKLQRTLERFRIGASGIRTSDAVYEGIRMLRNRPENHKRVIVVISEGLDNGSYINLGETLRTAQLHNVQIYPIYLSTLKARLKKTPAPPPSVYPPGISPLPASPGTVNTPTTMQQARYSATPNMIPLIVDLVVGIKNLVFKDAAAALRAGTGGEDYKPLTSEGIQEAIVSIGQDLRSQYLLAYTPNNLNKYGLYHEIEVKTPYDQAKVRARPGYFYGPRPVLEGEPEFVDNSSQ